MFSIEILEIKNIIVKNLFIIKGVIRSMRIIKVRIIELKIEYGDFFRCNIKIKEKIRKIKRCIDFYKNFNIYLMRVLERKGKERKEG